MQEQMEGAEHHYNSLCEELERAQIGYDTAIEALSYMPKESRPYTQQTADDYRKDIVRLKKLLKIT